MNDDQLFDNYLVMFIMWLRSKNLERKSRKLVCGLQKQSVPSMCLLFCVFLHKLKNLVLILNQISTVYQLYEFNIRCRENKQWILDQL